jgi:hypothetical protein
MQFTEDQVTQLAPDASSLKSGKDLANERKWLNFQLNQRVLWGEVQGSGKDPYRTQVDLNAIAFKCSCPSRKFPCKHGLGVLFLYAQKPNSFKTDVSEPAWVSEWMDKRSEKATQKAEKQEEEANDPEKQEKKAKDKEKRETNRYDKVAAGVAELDLWLRDLIRTGLISLPEKSNAFFEKTAARMVDSQAGGLANLVKEFNEINFYEGTSWHSKALEQAARIFLLIEAFKNLDKLPPKIQEDVRSMIGWSHSQKELLEDAKAESMKDEWLVIGRKTTLEEDLTVQRNWLYGCQSKRFAFVLNFAYRNTPISTLLVPGTITKAELVFYPSNMPFRAVVKQQASNTDVINHQLFPLENWQQSNDALVDKISQFTWADDVPQLVENLRVFKHQAAWFLRDSEGLFLPISVEFSQEKIFNLLAISGGKPLTMFLLRSGNAILPLGIVEGYGYQIL